MSWADEISVGFANKPISIYIAILEKHDRRLRGLRMPPRRSLGPPVWRKELEARVGGRANRFPPGAKELGYVLRHHRRQSAN